MKRNTIIAATLAACSSPSPPSYVLVHGAWLDDTGWTATADELRAAGAEVATVLLPAHGSDPTPASQATLDAYVSRVSAAIDTAPRPVILVGHSMAGIVITQLAEQRPADLEQLVYLAAYVPVNGQSLFDLAMTDADSQIGPSLIFEADGTVGVQPAAFPDLFCADCSTDARRALVAAYHPEPGAPLQQKVAIGPGAAGVAKLYVHTSQDRVVSPALQARMVAATPMDGEVVLATSHAAMLSQPHEVAEALRQRL